MEGAIRGEESLTSTRIGENWAATFDRANDMKTKGTKKSRSILFKKVFERKGCGKKKVRKRGGVAQGVHI